MILGIISATKQYSIFDYISMLGALAGVSMPIFWLGLVFMLIFALNLGWLPMSGRLSVGIDLETRFENLPTKSEFILLTKSSRLKSISSMPPLSLLA